MKDNLLDLFNFENKNIAKNDDDKQSEQEIRFSNLL